MSHAFVVLAGCAIALCLESHEISAIHGADRIENIHRLTADQVASLLSSRRYFLASPCEVNSPNYAHPLYRRNRSLFVPRPDTTVPKAVAELLQQGADAVPLLLRHLSDERVMDTTKVVVLPQSPSIGGTTRAYDYNPFNQRTKPLVFRESSDVPPSGVITLGDLCYMLLGQIVNRNYADGSGGDVGPSSFPELIEQARREWAAVSKADLVASLRRDVTLRDSPDRISGALLRLGAYDQSALVETVIEALNIPVKPVRADFDWEQGRAARTPNFMTAIEFSAILGAIATVESKLVDDWCAKELAEMAGRGYDNGTEDYYEQVMDGVATDCAYRLLMHTRSHDSAIKKFIARLRGSKTDWRIELADEVSRCLESEDRFNWADPRWFEGEQERTTRRGERGDRTERFPGLEVRGSEGAHVERVILSSATRPRDQSKAGGLTQLRVDQKCRD